VGEARMVTRASSDGNVSLKTHAFALAVMAILSPAMNVATGGPVVPSKEVVAPSPLSPSSYFRANELDLGAFATYGTSFGSQSNFRGIGDHARRGGAEGSYFPLFWAGLRVQGAVINLIPGDNAAGIVRGDFLARDPLDILWHEIRILACRTSRLKSTFNGQKVLAKFHEMEVTCRFVRNCTLRKVGGRCKAGLEWSQLPILQAVVATPMVVAGQVDVLPFQLEAFAGLYPPTATEVRPQPTVMAHLSVMPAKATPDQCQWCQRW